MGEGRQEGREISLLDGRHLVAIPCLLKPISNRKPLRKSIIKIGLFSFLCLAIAGSPGRLLGQTTKEKPAKPATENKETTNKKPSAGPFHGKLAALDKAAKTITVGKRTFHITSETQIKKAGKPATLDAGVVGEDVSGYVKPTEEGKLAATKVNFGPKIETKSSEKKKEK